MREIEPGRKRKGEFSEVNFELTNDSSYAAVPEILPGAVHRFAKAPDQVL